MNDFAMLARPTGIQMHGDYGIVQYGDDSRLVVYFYVKSVRSVAKSSGSGMPIHEDQIFVTMHPPGERLNIVDRPATEADKHRFPVQWSKFIQKAQQVPDGTPIDLLFPNNPSIADNLKTYGIQTVQQLANLSADAINNVGMGAQEYVNMANRYIQNATDGTAFHKMQEELRKKDQDYKILEHRFGELQAQFNGLLQQIKNPLQGMAQPAWVPGHDAATERIDLNHPSKDLEKDAPLKLADVQKEMAEVQEAPLAKANKKK